MQAETDPQYPNKGPCTPSPHPWRNPVHFWKGENTVEELQLVEAKEVQCVRKIICPSSIFRSFLFAEKSETIQSNLLEYLKEKSD
jgi:hypothetical protein